MQDMSEDYMTYSRLKVFRIRRFSLHLEPRGTASRRIDADLKIITDSFFWHSACTWLRFILPRAVTVHKNRAFGIGTNRVDFTSA